MDDAIDNSGVYRPYKIINGKIRWDDPYRFPYDPKFPNFPDGQNRPKCINDGCFNPVGYSNTTTTGLKILRTVCSTCHKDKDNVRDGVTLFKKDYCENRDGRLGFACSSIIHYSGVLELDHIDGDHSNNIHDNVQT